MRDKERLLSFDEPVAFIFSHSALREGWDNPNIFQICTLNQTASIVKKRQEVGRGVRLAVDQDGNRVWDESVNILTVVANESYEKYVATLQQEIEEDFGTDGVPPKPADARSQKTVRLRKEYMLKPEFQELWERIKHKTRYSVKVDTDNLIDEVVKELDEATIQPPRVAVTAATVVVGEENAMEARHMGSSISSVGLAGRHQLPDVTSVMTHLLEHTSPPISLTRKTLLKIFSIIVKKQEAMANPHEFATVAVRIIKDKLVDQLVNGVRYEKINNWYEMSRFEAEIESWEEYLVPVEHSPYDHVVYESEVERQFTIDLDKRKDIRLFVKLPRWFTVPTPVGTYNPDWAIVMEPRDEFGEPTGEQLLYLVRETKDTLNLSELRPDERRKIVCGERHFRDALGVDYKVVTQASQLP